MKKIAAISIAVLLLAGCASASESGESEVPTDLAPIPTEVAETNKVPMNCDLPELEKLFSSLAGKSLKPDANPITKENSSAEDYQDFVDGKYMVCSYVAEEPEDEVAYSIWRLSDEVEWQLAMDDINTNLEPGELVFEQGNLSYGNLPAYYLLEPAGDGGFFTGHSYLDGVSLLIFTNLAEDEDLGKRIMETALVAMAK